MLSVPESLVAEKSSTRQGGKKKENDGGINEKVNEDAEEI